MRRADTLVVGNGLIGAATARHLAEAGQRVAIIGPGEPTDPASHDGVFASHYDQGRLVSGFGADGAWAAIGRRAIAEFASLGDRSGIEFHRPVGRLSALRLTAHDRDAAQRRVAESSGRAEWFGRDRGWRARFPEVALPPDLDVLFEGAGAGVIDPRALIRAQNAVASEHGAEIVERRVATVETTRAGVTVTTVEGGTWAADRVVVAAGAFTNAAGLLPSPLDLRWKTETTVWGDVTADTAAALAHLPAVTSDVDDPDLDDVYLAPPLRYPDGVHRLKLGANTRHESWPSSTDEISAWFRAGSSDRDLPALARQLRAHLPEVEITNVSSHRCIVTYTSTGLPIIDGAPGDETGRCFVAVGGNGQGAGGSDTLGRLAANVILDEPWPDDIDRDRCRVGGAWSVGSAARRATRRAAQRTR